MSSLSYTESTRRRLPFRAWRLAGLLAATLPVLTGCQGMGLAGLPGRESAQIRLIHGSADTPPLDVYLGDNALAYGIGFGMRTGYVPASQGDYVLQADMAGSRQALGVDRAALVAGRRYTAIVGDFLGSLRLTVLPDQTKPAPAGESSLRFVNEAVRSGPLDIYLVPSGSPPGRTPVLSLSFGSIEPYRNVPAGVYSLMVLPAGAEGSVSASLFTSPQISLASGSVRTIVLMDGLSSERATPDQRSLHRGAGAGEVQAIVNEDGEVPST